MTASSHTGMGHLNINDPAAMLCQYKGGVSGINLTSSLHQHSFDPTPFESGQSTLSDTEEFDSGEFMAEASIRAVESDTITVTPANAKATSARPETPSPAPEPLTPIRGPTVIERSRLIIKQKPSGLPTPPPSPPSSTTPASLALASIPVTPTRVTALETQLSDVNTKISHASKTLKDQTIKFNILKNEQDDLKDSFDEANELREKILMAFKELEAKKKLNYRKVGELKGQHKDKSAEVDVQRVIKDAAVKDWRKLTSNKDALEIELGKAVYERNIERRFRDWGGAETGEANRMGQGR